MWAGRGRKILTLPELILAVAAGFQCPSVPVVRASILIDVVSSTVWPVVLAAILTTVSVVVAVLILLVSIINLGFLCIE